MITVELRVQIPHQGNSPGILCPDYDPVRAHEIIESSTFFQKFRIRNNSKWDYEVA
ncbi:hypothetical protein IMCC9480_3125 [Oxalobacteraceae bacterium IMCC9480]|nr:hypothetical protein IMCC9480_3125 [Oxalobacteraceae bacterium IMCC9480]